jgi:hypothetical protein
MSPDAAVALYRRSFDNVGTEAEVVIRRYSGPAGPSRPFFDAPCRGRVIGDRPVQLIGTVNQFDWKILVFVDDLIVAQFPLPILDTDKAVVLGKELTIKFNDGATRRYHGVILAYELQCRG